MTVTTAPTSIPQLRLSAREQSRRSATFGGLLNGNQSVCSRAIWVGMFFDGTNNNKERDQEQIADTTKRSHSNVVVLHDAFRDEATNGYFRFYMPGVGTPFRMIGEMSESSDGKAMAVGGEARIYWAMIQLYNAIHRAAGSGGRALVSDAEAERYINGAGFLASRGTLKLAESRRRGFFSGLESRLNAAIRDKRPAVRQINLSVFGFSRGAAEARTFCNWVVSLCTMDKGYLHFCGISIRFQFLGLFDTVASVGLADSTPLLGSPERLNLVDGLMGWADGTMEVPHPVERCVHYVAAHEIRKSFPLSTVRRGASYPSNCVEVVYPGAHSDVGGGYSPGDQGKSHGSRNRLASQVTLLNMYNDARKSGVPLMDRVELADKQQKSLIEDLEIAPDLAAHFRDYATWSKASAARVEDLLFRHMRLYWRWRLKVAPRFTELASFGRANQQDKEDLRASELDFQRDMQRITQRKRQIDIVRQRHGTNPPPLSPLYAAAIEESQSIRDVPPGVNTFFDEYIHDSHASFYLAGPVTAYDKSEKVKLVREKQRRGDVLTPLEHRILATDSKKGSDFPVVSDTDFEDLLDLEDFKTERTVKMMTTTRRESDGHVRRRVVFDKS
ncbi:DUF2235 domain-containing protein [Aromatoleum toluolicum]|uniref:DUF2235 domain-containing protein n=1 Tax=Aromatoleum toluolicum TaxID=90060 RepID=A0ABX1NEM3_9RHOO|nr:DUF2235 domain-containing protein [Aromatoleum toluolicum]NMF97752.1 DUF2235 domain-containing protein [Aromatoleum toluolicum]